MKRIYTKKKDADRIMSEISKAQKRANVFINVSVKPYKGKKYSKSDTVVIVVG